MAEANPEMKGVIWTMVNATTVSDQEKEFLLKHFIGGSFKQIFDAKAQAIKDFWPTATSWFDDFNDILNVKKELYAERMDDLLEGMTAPTIDPNQLMFYINKWY